MSKISLKKLYKKLLDLVENYSKQEAINIIQKYLYLKFNASNTDLLIDKFISWNKFIEEEIISDLNKISKGIPIQHVLNKEFFYNNLFYVDQNVLIPRPETEELVDMIIKNESTEKIKTILDIGSGSGCIAITLDKNVKSKVIGLDVSEKAIIIAKNNNINVGANVTFIQKKIEEYKPDIKFDLIVRNPPYIPIEDIDCVDENVKKLEPKSALFVNDDPIYFYKIIIKFSKKYINNNGKIYFEINDKYYSDLCKYIRDANLSYSFVKDLNRKFRFLIIKF